MGYNYSLGLGNYFNFIPASYGILNAIHGSYSDLLAIDLDSMVLSGYNTASYYNQLNNLQNISMSLFSQMANIAAGYPSLSSTAGSTSTGSSSSTSSSEGKKTGEDDEKDEYNLKVEFIEDFLAFKNIKSIKKELSEIKKGEMTYEEAIKKLDRLLTNISTNYSADLEAFANKRAKARYESSDSKQNGTGHDLAIKAKGAIRQWTNTNMNSQDFESMEQLLDELNNDNILDFIASYSRGSGETIISNIQEKARNIQGVFEYSRLYFDGEKLFRWAGGAVSRNKDIWAKFDNYLNTMLSTVCGALIDKAESYSEYLSTDAIDHLDDLKSAVANFRTLVINPSLSKKFMAVYNDIKNLDAEVVNQQVEDEILNVIPRASINVTGAKTGVKHQAKGACADRSRTTTDAEAPIDPVQSNPRHGI